MAHNDGISFVNRKSSNVSKFIIVSTNIEKKKINKKVWLSTKSRFNMVGKVVFELKNSFHPIDD